MDFGLKQSCWSICGLVLLGLGLGNTPKVIANPEPELPLLQAWEFNPQQQQLRLQTSTMAVPQYSSLKEPTRLVIDFANTRWPDATLNKTYDGVIRQLRIGQFNDQTTRVVLTWTGEMPPNWSPGFQRLPQGDGSVIWVFEFPGAIAQTPSPTLSDDSPPAFVFPPALLPSTETTPITIPPLPDLP